MPNLISYDPAFAYEIAVIIEDGIRRMYREGESIFYYITLMNEQYEMPPMPEGSREGILKGMYRLRAAEPAQHQPRAHLLGGGAILNEALKLPPADRGRIIRRLIESFDDGLDEADADDAWAEVIARRLAELDAGRATVIVGKAAIAEARNRCVRVVFMSRSSSEVSGSCVPVGGRCRATAD